MLLNGLYGMTVWPELNVHLFTDAFSGFLDHHQDPSFISQPSLRFARCTAAIQVSGFIPAPCLLLLILTVHAS